MQTMKGGSGRFLGRDGLCEVLCTVKSTHAPRCRLPVERGVSKDAEPVSLLVADVLRNNTVEIVIPGRVLVDEFVGRRFVAAVLNLQNFCQQAADDVVV